MELNLWWIPERIKDEWVFVHYRAKAKVWDELESIKNISWSDVIKWTRVRVEEIIVTPKPNVRWFDKRIKLAWYEWEFNPKKFKKVELESL